MTERRTDVLLALLLLVFLMTLSKSARSTTQKSEGVLQAIWIGQIGQDRVGPSSKPGPSGVQDLVFELRNLPRQLAVRSISIRGKGGDEWLYKGRYGPWAAEFQRDPKSDRGLVFVEPSREEQGRTFEFEIVFENGQTTKFYAKGGTADPNLRTAEASLRAIWLGQDGTDRTGPTAAVGPDGWQDLRIRLEQLSPGIGVSDVQVKDGQGQSWSSGRNMEKVRNAEFLPDPKDKSRGDLYLDPAGPLQASSSLSIEVTYENGKRDRVSVTAPGPFTPQQTNRVALPQVQTLELRTQWLIRDQAVGEEVLLLLEGLPKRHPSAVVLTNSSRGVWAWTSRTGSSLPGTEDALLLDWTQAQNGSASLRFLTNEVQEGSRFSVRLVYSDDSVAIADLAAQNLRREPIRPLVSPAESPRSEAELRRMAASGGTILLPSNTIRLSAPLTLAVGTHLKGQEGSVLEFDQPPGAGTKPWAEAIRIEGGDTILEDFKVQFAGAVGWDSAAPYGPAIIGVRAGAERPNKVVLERLSLQAPPPSSDWEESPHAMRLMEGTFGVISGNRIQAGMIAVRGGPWRITENTFLGPRSGTFAYAAITAHESRGLKVIKNRVSQKEQGGKLWRFLVMPRWGYDGLVHGNVITDVGPRDDDPRPHPNAPEIVLTEGYRSRYEGRLATLRENGRLIGIFEPQGEPVKPGDVVAVVSGRGAGQWAQISQVLGPRVFWLDRNIVAEEADVAIGPGFVRHIYSENLIDCGGSRLAVPLVLAGSHYGTRIERNVLKGGGHAIRLTAFPTEQPVRWGWSFCPTMGAELIGNRIVDTDRGSFLGVERTSASKSTSGRTYFTARLEGNNVAWTQPPRPGSDRVAWSIGTSNQGEPEEALLEMSGSTVSPPENTTAGPALRIECATVNGKTYRGAKFELTIQPSHAERP